MHLIATHKPQILIIFQASNAQAEHLKLSTIRERNQSFSSGKCSSSSVPKRKQRNTGISGTDKTEV